MLSSELLTEQLCYGILRQSPCFTFCRFSLEKSQVCWCWFTPWKKGGWNPFETWHTLLLQLKKKHKRKFYNSTLLLFIPYAYYFRITTKCLKITKKCLIFNECIVTNFYIFSRQIELFHFHDFFAFFRLRLNRNIFTIFFFNFFSSNWTAAFSRYFAPKS